MIADGNIFNNGLQMNNQDSELAEIERKIKDNEYDLNETDSDHAPVKNGNDLFFATEIETSYEKPLAA